MRHKKLKLSAVLLLVLGLTGLQAQTMYVKEKSGTQTAYTLSDIRKMSFSSGNILVIKTSGSTDTYALEDIRYLNFKDLTTGLPIAKQDNLNNLTVFPNPVNDVLHIQFAASENQQASLELLSIEGKVVYSQTLSRQAVVYQINISSLPKGLYVCKINNGTSIETIKFIKQ